MRGRRSRSCFLSASLCYWIFIRKAVFFLSSRLFVNSSDLSGFDCWWRLRCEFRFFWFRIWFFFFNVEIENGRDGESKKFETEGKNQGYFYFTFQCWKIVERWRASKGEDVSSMIRAIKGSQLNSTTFLHAFGLVWFSYLNHWYIVAYISSLGVVDLSFYGFNHFRSGWRYFIFRSI